MTIVRDVDADQEARIQASQWGVAEQEFFRRSHRDLRRGERGPREVTLSAWFTPTAAA